MMKNGNNFKFIHMIIHPSTHLSWDKVLGYNRVTNCGYHCFH